LYICPIVFGNVLFTQSLSDIMASPLNSF